MTNREWLYSLHPSALAAWFDSEHVEHSTVDRELFRSKMSRVADFADEIRNEAMDWIDEGMA